MIDKIAKDIANETILDNWEFYLLFLLISLVATAVSSFLVQFFSGRGKAYATKADFDELLKQLKVTTKTSESIKTAISHSDWALKEFKLLKRNKLEELLNTLYDIEQWINDQTNNVFFRDSYDKSVAPIKKLKLIGLLYFTELADEITNFDICYKAYKVLLLREEKKITALKYEGKIVQSKLDFASKYKQHDVDGLMLNLQEIADKTTAIITEATKEYFTLYDNQLTAVLAIEKKAGVLMQGYIAIE